MLHSGVVTGISQHAKRHIHSRWGRMWSPLCQRTGAGKVNVACLYSCLQMTDGAQVPLGRQTTASLGCATGKWWMLPSPSHIWHKIKSGKSDGRCYVGCSGGCFVFHFESEILSHVQENKEKSTKCGKWHQIAEMLSDIFGQLISTFIFVSIFYDINKCLYSYYKYREEFKFTAHVFNIRQGFHLCKFQFITPIQKDSH